MRTVVLALTLLAATPALAQQPDPFDPLNLLLTRERLRELEDALAAGDPLVTACRDQVLQEAAPFLARDPDPIVGVLKAPAYYGWQRAQQQAVTRRLRGDAWGAHALALAFALTNDVRYAAQAERYLFAWVDRCARPADGGEPWMLVPYLVKGDTGIIISYSFPSFFYAYDLLRGLGQIDAAEHSRFVAWLQPFIGYYRAEVGWRDNQHAWQALFLATAAHVTEDRALFDDAVARYRRNLDSAPLPSGTLGRELLRGEKAATYSLMAIEAMLQLVAIAERHGHAGLRDLRATRTPLGTRHRGQGPTLHDVVDDLADLLADPGRWRRAHRVALLGKTPAGPARATEWGWAFELAFALWEDPRHASLTAEAPYGLTPARSYTTAFATLHFRPLNGRSPLAP
jgi:hypothetical protein